MSYNTASASGGTITGFVLLTVQGIPMQNMIEVFTYGLIGGLAGILIKILMEFIVKKITQFLNRKQDASNKK